MSRLGTVHVNLVVWKPVAPASCGDETRTRDASCNFGRNSDKQRAGITGSAFTPRPWHRWQAHQKIAAGWADQKVVREIIVFRHAHGVSTSRTVRIFKTYGAEAVVRGKQLLVLVGQKRALAVAVKGSKNSRR